MTKYASTAESPRIAALSGAHVRRTVIARLGQHELIEVEQRVPDSTLDTRDLPYGVEPCEVLFSEKIWTQVLVVRAESGGHRPKTTGSFP
jgi:hypothetical protein